MNGTRGRSGAIAGAAASISSLTALKVDWFSATRLAVTSCSCARSTPAPRLLARVGRHGDRPTGAAHLLDDDVPAGALDHDLHVGDLVPRHDHEERGILSHASVVLDPDLDL